MSDIATQDFVKNDTDLWVAFSQAIVDDPSILEDIPDGSTVVLIPDDDPEIAEANIQRGVDAVRRGSDVYIRHVSRSKLL